MPQRTAVYRIFNATNRLLYVGIGRDPHVRLRHHAANKAWWPEAVSNTIEWCESRPAALKAEAVAIRDEDPVYNVRRHPYRVVVRPKLKGDVVIVTTQGARAYLGDRVNAGIQDGQHTVIERYGKPAAVLVPVAWYISKGGDPREPLSEIAEGK